MSYDDKTPEPHPQLSEWERELHRLAYCDPFAVLDLLADWFLKNPRAKNRSWLHEPILRIGRKLTAHYLKTGDLEALRKLPWVELRYLEQQDRWVAELSSFHLPEGHFWRPFPLTEEEARLGYRPPEF